MSEEDRAKTFDDLFGSDPDPWAFETSVYERDKRIATMAALPNRQFAQGLEIGCAIGVSTADLAFRCDALLGIDISQVALSRARERLSGRPHVRFQRAQIPCEWPTGQFDLIVLSKVLYFLTAEEVGLTARLAYEATVADGICLLVNWTGENTLPVDGNGAVTTFMQSAPWRSLSTHAAPHYRIDVLRPS